MYAPLECLWNTQACLVKFLLYGMQLMPSPCQPDDLWVVSSQEWDSLCITSAWAFSFFYLKPFRDASAYCWCTFSPLHVSFYHTKPFAHLFSSGLAKKLASWDSELFIRKLLYTLWWKHRLCGKVATPSWPMFATWRRVNGKFPLSYHICRLTTAQLGKRAHNLTIVISLCHVHAYNCFHNYKNELFTIQFFPW